MDKALFYGSAGKVTTGDGKPHQSEGSNGSITLRRVNGQITLFAKFGNTWYGRDLGPTLIIGHEGAHHVKISNSGLDIKDNATSIASFQEDITLTSGTINFHDGTRNRLVIGANDIDMYDEAGNNTLNIDTGVITIGHHANSKIVLTGTAGTGAGDEAITIGSKFKIFGDASVRVDDIKLSGKIILVDSNPNINIGTNQAGLGVRNIFIGDFAGQDIENSGNYNIGLGYKAGADITTGDDNVSIGKQSGDNLTTGSNNISIGSNIDFTAVDVSNQAIIGDADITDVYMAQDAGAKVHLGSIQFPSIADDMGDVDANTREEKSRVLDHYSEGSFQYQILGSTTGAWNVRDAYNHYAYTRVGRVVHIQGNIETLADGAGGGDGGSGGQGTVSIELPFTSADLEDFGGRAIIPFSFFAHGGTIVNNAFGRIIEDEKLMLLYYITDGGVETAITHALVDDTLEGRFSGTYIAKDVA